MRIGFVIQRYGSEINGGAELHCRLLAEYLAQSHDIEVFTTRAKDYIYWDNHYPGGQTQENGVLVHRFPVRKKRNLHRFHSISQQVFGEEHSIHEELRWIRENGPYSPKLIKVLARRSKQFDFFLQYSVH